ncbi:alpha/beta hydrolase [Clostridium oryzae]|uniref:Acetyl esterase n=1 Tax=Clostridium oryzae TaxID=1450648 RepID=A0A1V4IMQ0_9CLOT|nr:alpha/beta hydrolase [Clostridium oryzae]OPJ61163.1 acetyl esterase [Clostridium oryzae]
MAKQLLKRLAVENRELEWLYVPDVEYCKYENCKRCLQLIIPYKRNWNENKKYPIILFIPGSAWHRQEMYNSIPARAELAKRGFAIAEVQYRESELAVFPAQVIDAKKAIRFIHSIAEQFHIDTDNIFISGDSSGGHIALLAGLTATYGELDIDMENSIPCKVNGIISYCAPTDMSLSNGDGPIEDLLGTNDVTNVPGLAKSASCATYLSAERNIPPILMFHGTQDELVSVEHSRNFFEKLKQLDKEVEYYELENEGHCCPTFWGNAILDIVEKFVRRNCK